MVITIIVLLILAGVSIAMLTGENGILRKATDAKEKNTKQTAEEKVKLAVMASYKENGEISINELGKNLNAIDGIDENFNQNEFELDENNLEKVIVVDKQKIKLTLQTNKTVDVKVEDSTTTPTEPNTPTDPNEGEDTPTTPSFDGSNLTIGEAKNADKYGWKVPEYNVKTSEFTTGVWRLFYQDDNYTYLITDECVGNYALKEYVSNYSENSTKVGIVGQKLNSMITELTKSTYEWSEYAFFATAWLTDTSKSSKWNNYKNSDAVFAIGSPIIELFAASYNATGKDNKIEPVFAESGYTENTSNDWLSSNDNYGIYNKDMSTYWWIASPSGTNSTNFNLEMVVCSDEGYFGWKDSYSDDKAAVRPIVCIPTHIFESKYTLINN